MGSKEGTTWVCVIILYSNIYYFLIGILLNLVIQIIFILVLTKKQIDSVLDKKTDDVKIVQCELYDANGKLDFIKISKAVVDPQFYEKM